MNKMARILSKIKRELRSLIQNVRRRFILKKIFVRSSKGAILIEFACSIPVFLALLYYIHDIPHLQRWNNRMEQVSLQMAQMLQTVSNGAKVTKTDITNIIKGAFLTVFPGITMHPTGNMYLPLGYYIRTNLYYVKGEADGKASVKWRICSYYHSTDIATVTLNTDNAWTVVRYNENVAPSEIHPDLRINEGEVKIISEVMLKYVHFYRFSDGSLCSTVSNRERFNFLFLTPAYSAGTDNDSCFFNTVTIFSPNTGLFYETSPPS